MFFDHMFALTLIGAGIGAALGGRPRHVFIGAWTGGMTLAPFSWFMKKHGKFNSHWIQD